MKKRNFPAAYRLIFFVLLISFAIFPRAKANARVSFTHYTIRFGDSISSIALKYHTTVGELIRLNHLHSMVIRQGAYIIVPVRSYHNARYYETASAYSVTVRPGQTLGSIAQDHGTTVSNIVALNGLKGTMIYPGERLRIKGSAIPRARAAKSLRYARYVVRSGDTLSLIALRYGTSVSELMRINSLRTSMIRRGSVLEVPGGVTPARPYSFISFITVRPGQSLSSIAQSHGTTVASIMSINRLRGTMIFPGERLKIYEYSRFTCNVHANDAEGKKIVRVAFRYRGIPYIWGGTSRNGMDCSGFVQKVFAKEHIQLPRTAAEQARLGIFVPKSRLEPGDLVFFRTYARYISHVGIYIGHGKFINANSGEGEVTVSNLYSSYFEKTYAFAKDIR